MSETHELTPVDGVKRAVKGLDNVTINTVVIVPWYMWLAIVTSLTFGAVTSCFYFGRMLGKFPPAAPAMQAVPTKGCPAP